MLHVEFGDGFEELPEARIQHVREGKRLQLLAGDQAGTGMDLVAAALGAVIAEILARQIALMDQIFAQHVLVFGLHQPFELARGGGLGDQLGGIAARVTLDLALADPLVGQRPLALVRIDVGGVIVIDHDLERHIEVLGVIERRAMVVGNAPGTDVDIETIIEIAGLGVHAHLLGDEAFPRRLGAAAGKGAGFENGHLVAELRELVGRCRARVTGAEDQDLLALARTAKFRGTFGGGRGGDSESVHSGKNRGGSPDAAQLLEKAPARHSRHNQIFHRESID